MINKTDKEMILDLTQSYLRLTNEGECRRAGNAKAVRDEMLRRVRQYDKKLGHKITAEVKEMEGSNV